MTELFGRLLLDGVLETGTVTLDGDRIGSVRLAEDASTEQADLPIVAPGLIDLHVHGYGGCRPLEEEGDEPTSTGLAGMAAALASEGTTSFLPTLFPTRPDELGAASERVWSRARELEREGGGARVLGLHLEGPFVNPNCAGALPRDGLAEPSVASLRAILGPATGDGRGIRTVTLAPELPGAADLVEELARAGVRVSFGHSLATAAEARTAADANARRGGETGATHLYNAMRGIHHREIGLVGFALSSDALVAELIGDLVHVGADAVELALRARGPAGLALVSDALWGAGTGCDVFQSHGHTCRVTDGAIWIEDPTAEGGRRLTGAAASQLEAIRRLTAAGVVSVEEALTMASATPARTLGLQEELGTLAAGTRADLIVLEPGTLALREAFVGGRRLGT